MKNSNDRREFIRLLTMAGFSMCLPSCVFLAEEQKEVEQTKEPQVKKDSITSIEKAIESNNVTYFTSKDKEYERLNTSYNLAVPKQPSIIALCKNTEGVAEAIQLATKKGLKIAVKSGGHSFESFSSIDEGLQLNLSLMKEISWKNEQQLSVQPACTLKELYDETLPKKRLVPAGSCGTVGIGGLTLGGGYGFFSRKYGLTCDCLLSAKFVDGKGKIHQTKKGEDLMWGLKGGGNGNFGVVTEFTFETVPAPSFFTRHRFKAYKLDKARAKQLLEAYFKYSSKLPESCFAAFVLNHKTMVLLITNYGGENEALNSMIAAFSKIADKSSIGKKRDLAKSLVNYYGIDHPIPFKNASAGYYENYNTIAPFIDDVLGVVLNKRGLIYQINTLGGKINSPEFQSNSCYPHRAMPYLSELQSYWEEGKKATTLVKAFDEIQQIVYNAGIRRQYRNYPTLGFSDWEQAYYGESYSQLQTLKRKYDPNDLFSHQQTIKL